MKKVAGIAAAVVLLLSTAGPASAQTGKVYAKDTVVIANGVVHPLVSVTIEANAGDEFYVYARLRTKSARQDPTHRMLVALLLGCRDNEVEVRTTQNIDYGDNVIVHRGRYIFEAPRDGVFECKLQARGGIHGKQSDPPARFTIDGANTYMSVSGKQPSWVRHRYQNDQVRIRTGRARDLLPISFTAPDGVNSFSATADIEMTNCYNTGYVCDTFPSNRKSAVVETRLIAMQKARDGGYCRINRWPASALKRTTITWEEHHKKAYHRIEDVPVSTNASCTRDFRVKVYTRVRSGNDLMIEMKPYTNAFIKR